MALIDDIPEHIPPYKLVVSIEAYDPNPDTPFTRQNPGYQKRYELIAPMSFCPGFRSGVGWGFEYYHHQARLNPDQPNEFCTDAFSVLLPLLNRIDLSKPINPNHSENRFGLVSDEDTLYVRCPHGMAIFKIHREPVTCPGCGEKTLYVEKYDRWYCKNCDKYTKPVDKNIAWPAKDRAPNEPAAAPHYWP